MRCVLWSIGEIALQSIGNLHRCASTRKVFGTGFPAIAYASSEYHGVLRLFVNITQNTPSIGRLFVRRLRRTVKIRQTQPQSEDRLAPSAPTVEEYAASLSLDLSFQNLAHELEHLTSEYGSPTGAFLLAEENGAFVGCVGVRQFFAGTGEVKRLYVNPAARGRGVGRLLAEGIAAKELGYARLLLDALPVTHRGSYLWVFPAAGKRHSSRV
jgi:GNAT superfamily N-acetyltransferase